MEFFMTLLIALNIFVSISAFAFMWLCKKNNQKNFYIGFFMFISYQVYFINYKSLTPLTIPISAFFIAFYVYMLKSQILRIKKFHFYMLKNQILQIKEIKRQEKIKGFYESHKKYAIKPKKKKP